MIAVLLVLRRARLVLMAAIACRGAVALDAAPAHVILTVPPAPAAAALAGQLTAWRQSGAIASAQLLNVVSGARSAETVAPNPALGAVAVVEFADEAALARWTASSEPQRVPGLVATRVDVLSRLEVTPRDSHAAVFLIAEYEIGVPPARYQGYVDGYVVPQLNAWKESGLITGAVMYGTRERAGAPFHAMLVLEHRDAAAFARRDAVKEGSRKELAALPSWKAWSDVKAAIRTEKFLTRATLAAVPGPRG